MPLSCTILSKNSDRTIQKTLESLSFVDEIILLDTGSTDSTIEIAKKFPRVKIFHENFLGFGRLHNIATSHAAHDWILSIDSDEVVTIPLRDKILSLKLNSNCVYSFAYQNILFGKKINHSGWYPDRHIRLYNRNMTKFTEDKVHEKIIVDGLTEIALQEKIEHHSYLEIGDFLRKMQIYTDLFSEQKKGTPSSFKKALFHGIFAFIKTYFLKLGFLDGMQGVIIANYQAQTAFYKYLKLWEANQRC